TNSATHSHTPSKAPPKLAKAASYTTTNKSTADHSMTNDSTRPRRPAASAPPACTTAGYIHDCHPPTPASHPPAAPPHADTASALPCKDKKSAAPSPHPDSAAPQSSPADPPQSH